MKLQPDRAEGVNLIRGYQADSISVNTETYPHGILVPATGAVLDWAATSWDALTEAHFARIVELRPELVVFGTGTRLRFAPPALVRALMTARIGIETMDTAAACRTYNFLVGEGRQALAALLPPTA